MRGGKSREGIILHPDGACKWGNGLQFYDCSIWVPLSSPLSAGQCSGTPAPQPLASVAWPRQGPVFLGSIGPFVPELVMSIKSLDCFAVGDVPKCCFFGSIGPFVPEL